MFSGYCCKSNMALFDFQNKKMNFVVLNYSNLFKELRAETFGKIQNNFSGINHRVIFKSTSKNSFIVPFNMGQLGGDLKIVFDYLLTATRYKTCFTTKKFITILYKHLKSGTHWLTLLIFYFFIVDFSQIWKTTFKTSHNFHVKRDIWYNSGCTLVL